MSIGLRQLHPGRLFTAAALLASATLARPDGRHHKPRVRDRPRERTGARSPPRRSPRRVRGPAWSAARSRIATGSFRSSICRPGTTPWPPPLTGFHSSTEDVRLDIGSARTIDFRLSLETVQESVTVTSAVPLVEVTNTSASTTMQTQSIKTLPLNGRNYQDLVLLTPETRKDPESRGTVLVSGQRGINTNTTLDGMDFDNGFFGGTFGSAEGRAPLSISQESIKEFSRHPQRRVRRVRPVRRRRDQPDHQERHERLPRVGLLLHAAARDGREARPTGIEAPDQKKEQYGGSVGGPILRDHLFFFASYDQQKQNVGIPVNSVVLDPDIAATLPGLGVGPDLHADAGRPRHVRRGWTTSSPARSGSWRRDELRAVRGRPRHVLLAEPDERPQRHRGHAVARLRRLLERASGARAS